MSGWNSYQPKEVRALRGISQRSERPSNEVQENLVNLNQSVRYMSQMMTVMQNGIDDANRNIFQIFMDAIEDLLIIFGIADGDTLSFDWGDLDILSQNLGYIFNAILGGVLGIFGLDGLLNIGLLPGIPIGNLTNQGTPLIDDSSFNRTPLGREGTWYRDPSGGVAGGACAALGSSHGLVDFFTGPMSVGAGENISISVSALNGTYSIGAIFLVDGEVHSEVNSANFTAGPDSYSDGNFTATVPASVTSMAAVIRPVAPRPAGTFRIDNFQARRPSSEIPDSWVAGLPDFIQKILSLFGVLDIADLMNGRLLDAFAPNIIQDVIDGIFNGFANFGNLEALGLPRIEAMNTIFGLLNMNLNTSARTSKLEADLAALAAGEFSINDDFERPNEDPLGAPWTPFYAVGSGNSRSIILAGTLSFMTNFPTALGVKEVAYKHDETISTDSWTVRMTLATSQKDLPASLVMMGGSVANDGSHYAVSLAMSSASMTVNIFTGNLSPTAIYTLAYNSLSAGDVIEFQRGEKGGVNLHKYRIVVNGVERASFTDPNKLGAIGPDYRSFIVAQRGQETSFGMGMRIPARIAAISYSELS